MQRCSPIALAAMLFLALPLCASPIVRPETTAIVSRINRLPVQSSVLITVGYSVRLRAVEIEFRNGAIYRYLDVAPSVFHALLDAQSKARFYDQNIRHKYRSVHVRPRTS
ncbi:MAG: KTSC domain-containing protein [Chthoniobacterales bacterium]